MAATFHFGEDNSTSTGSPAHGTTRSGIGNTNYATEVNWKAIDNCSEGSGGTAYSANPIIAGQNSFEKFQYGIFNGTFNQILNSKWSAHTAGTAGTGITLKGTVSSTYTTPSQTANSALTTDFSSIVAVGSGLAVSFSTVGPEGASPTSTLSAAGYSQFLISQIQTTTSAAPGDFSSSLVATLVYDEN